MGGVDAIPAVGDSFRRSTYPISIAGISSSPGVKLSNRISLRQRRLSGRGMLLMSRCPATSKGPRLPSRGGRLTSMPVGAVMVMTNSIGSATCVCVSLNSSWIWTGESTESVLFPLASPIWQNTRRLNPISGWIPRFILMITVEYWEKSLIVLVLGGESNHEADRYNFRR